MAWEKGGQGDRGNITESRKSLQGPETRLVQFLALGPAGSPGRWAGARLSVGVGCSSWSPGEGGTLPPKGSIW